MGTRPAVQGVWREGLSGGPLSRGPGVPGCAASWGYRGGDVLNSGVVVLSVVPAHGGGISGVQVGQLRGGGSRGQARPCWSCPRWPWYGCSSSRGCPTREHPGCGVGELGPWLWLEMLEMVGVVYDRCLWVVVVEGGVLDEQHPVWRGGGREHPTSGVLEAGSLRAALLGVIGVVQNSSV